MTAHAADNNIAILPSCCGFGYKAAYSPITAPSQMNKIKCFYADASSEGLLSILEDKMLRRAPTYGRPSSSPIERWRPPRRLAAQDY